MKKGGGWRVIYIFDSRHLRKFLSDHWLTAKVMDQTSVITYDKEYSLLKNSLEKSMNKWITVVINNQQQRTPGTGEDLIARVTTL